MKKKLLIIVTFILISLASAYANSNSIGNDVTKFRYESKVGYSVDTLSLMILSESKLRGVNITQKTISIEELVKYDSGNGFDYVLSGTLRFPFNAYYKFYGFEETKPLNSSSFQNSLNLFFGIEKKFDFRNDFSLDLAIGIDSFYLFEDESLYNYPLEADKESKISAYGIGGSLKVNYIIINNMQINIGFNFIYNPLVYGESINFVREISIAESNKYSGIYYSINPTIGISYSL